MDEIGVADRHVRTGSSSRAQTADAVSSFAADVRARRFPAAEHCYAMGAEERDRFLASLAEDA